MIAIASPAAAMSSHIPIDTRLALVWLGYLIRELRDAGDQL